MATTERETAYLELAERIYTEVDGADHKQHQAEKIQEIFEWLAEGDGSELNQPFEDIVAEWREYDSVEA